MELPFNLFLSAETKPLSVDRIPKLTANAIYPQSKNETKKQKLKRVGCQINHERALDKAIDEGAVTLLNPLSYESHTFPFGEARKRAVISTDDFKRFAEGLSIDVVIGPEASDQGDEGKPKQSGAQADWMRAAKAKADVIYKRKKEAGCEGSRDDIAKEIGEDFECEGVLSVHGKRLDAKYINRHGLKGWVKPKI